MNTPAAPTRKDKRKALKKLKRQQLRRQLAIRAKELENDPQEQLRLLQLQEEERQRSQRERNLFEESERLWIQKMMIINTNEDQQALPPKANPHHQNKEDHSDNEDNAQWDYVQAGPAQIIWRGNEIILKKTTIQLPKSHAHTPTNYQDADRPTSNPLPPQSQPLSSQFHTSTLPAHDVLNKMAQQTPNFGTEQDKEHCPFHLKTGVCRFGLRCNRVHLYPEKSCTLLIKNMYSGPGLAWELDEGLECTDEEVEHSYEEFYEDVHTEFLKFGELVNFKVCRNSSYHLRGNVYVHYKSLDSAVVAYESINGRYFAGKQIICDFVSVTRWKVAICGEYMKSRLKSCSRGSACNFLHCFRNPGGDYEWADWDKPPPKYWINKMISLFGFSDQSYYDNKATELGDVESSRSSDLKRTPSSDRYDSRHKKERHDCHFVSDDSDIERGNRKRRRNTSKSEKHQTHDSDRHHSVRKRSHGERLGNISRKHKERRNKEYHTEEGNDITESKRRHQNKEPREVSKGSFSEEEADVRREKSKRHRDNYSDNVSDNKSRRKHSTSMKRSHRKKHGEDASEEANYDGYSN